MGFHTPAAGNTMTGPELQTQLQAQLQTELDPDFQIVRLLGEGSMALVYVAREKALQRLVAIKVLKAELAKDERMRRRARDSRESHAPPPRFATITWPPCIRSVRSKTRLPSS